MSDTPLENAHSGITVTQGSGWPEGDALVQETLERCHASDALMVIEELIERVRTMQMPSRFRTDRTPNWDVVLHRPHALAAELSEAEYKRFQLLANVQTVRSRLIGHFARLGDIILDIEATSREM